jgi:hypothetical protein
VRWSAISFNPSRSTLRQFASLWVVFFGGWAGWQYAVAHSGALALVLALATAVGWLGILMPGAIRYVFVAATVLAFPIGWTVSHVVLALLFYGLFTPLGCLFRLAGRDPLALHQDRSVDSYWQSKPAATNVENYFHQY